MILSVLSGFGLLTKGTRPMSQLAVVVGGLWSACSITLSKYVVTNRQAEEQVKKRSSRKKQPETSIDQLADGEEGNATAVSEEAEPVLTAVTHTDEMKPDTAIDQFADGEEEHATAVSTEAEPVLTAGLHTDEIKPV